MVSMECPRRLTRIRSGTLKPRSEIRICFIGDSLVNGTGDEAALGWAGRLCAMANESDIPVTYYNLGIRRYSAKHEQRYSAALEE